MEYVGTGPPNSRFGRRRHNAATAAEDSGASLGCRVRPIPISRLLLWSHIAMVPEKGSKGKIDPSRAPGTVGDGTFVPGPDDPAGLRDSAGVGGWRAVAAGAEPRRGIQGYNTAVRDHSVRRSRTRRDIHSRSKPADAEPLRREPPCPSQARAGQRRMIMSR